MKTSTSTRTIAISGIAGSFSEEAARTFLHDTRLQSELLYATSARGTFEAVANGQAKYGIIPIENSNGGLVLETLYAAADFTYHIDRVFEINVQQNLITLPGAKREDIRQVVSHHQALAQSRFYLRREWPQAELIEYADTALAAKDLADGKLAPNTAIIASRVAAELYSLRILEPSIQDLKFNYTSFMVISRHRG